MLPSLDPQQGISYQERERGRERDRWVRLGPNLERHREFLRLG